MGRPKNEEEAERILSTAFDLFSTKGIEATSYSDIAKKAYVTKSHVQHYYPKKEQLIYDFVYRSLNAVLDIANGLPGFAEKDGLTKLIFIDYIQWYYSINNLRMIRMSMDILLERSITQAVIDTGVEYDMVCIMKEEKIRDIEAFEEALRFLYGGIYDRLYGCLSKGEDYHIEPFILYGIRLLAPFTESKVDETVVEELRQLIPRLEAEKRKYNRMLFGL